MHRIGVAVDDRQSAAAVHRDPAIALGCAAQVQHKAVEIEGEVVENRHAAGIVDVIQQLDAGIARSIQRQVNVLRLRCLFGAGGSHHQMQRGVFLYVVVLQRFVIFKGFARKEERLLMGRGAYLTLNFLLHIANRVAQLDIQRDARAGAQHHDRNLIAGCTCGAHAQGGAQHQRHEHTQKPFFHRVPSMMKVVCSLLRREQGDIPLPKYFTGLPQGRRSPPPPVEPSFG